MSYIYYSCNSLHGCISVLHGVNKRMRRLPLAGKHVRVDYTPACLFCAESVYPSSDFHNTTAVYMNYITITIVIVMDIEHQVKI